MHDAQGVQIAAPASMTYLHGGYGQMFAGIERALEGKRVGDTVQVQLEPEEAFGEYDAGLVRVEPLVRYGEGVEVGAQIEEDATLYTATDVADGKVVLDGNHPLAGMALRFSCVILSVRDATEEELTRGVSLP